MGSLAELGLTCPPHQVLLLPRDHATRWGQRSPTSFALSLSATRKSRNKADDSPISGKTQLPVPQHPGGQAQPRPKWGHADVVPRGLGTSEAMCSPGERSRAFKQASDAGLSSR